MLDDIKILGKHSFIYGIGLILVKGIGFFLIPLYTHFIPPADYGVLEMLDLMGYFLGNIIGLGIDQALFKFYHSPEYGKERHAILSTGIIGTSIFGIFIITMLMPFSEQISYYVMGDVEYSNLIIIFFIAFLISAILNMNRAILRVQNRSILFSSVLIANALVTILLNIYFVAILKLGIRGIIYSAIIGSTIFTLFLTGLQIRDLGVLFKREIFIKMLKYGFPFVPAGIFAFILNWSDRYFLRIYSDMESIGLYALGFKIGMIIVFLINMPFSFIWNAYLFEIQKKHNNGEIYARISTYYLFILCFFGLGISIFSQEIIQIIAAKEYINSYKIIPFITTAMIFMCLETVFQVGLLIEGKSSTLAIVKGMAACVCVILNVILIPMYDRIGAAIAVTISFFICSLAILHYSQRAHKIPFEYLKLVKIYLIAVCVYIISTICIFNTPWLNTFAKIIIFILFPICIYLLKCINQEEIKYMINNIIKVN